MYGSVGLCMAAYGQYMTVWGSVGLRMVVYGYVWQCMLMYRYIVGIVYKETGAASVGN